MSVSFKEVVRAGATREAEVATGILCTQGSRRKRPFDNLGDRKKGNERGARRRKKESA